MKLGMSWVLHIRAGLMTLTHFQGNGRLRKKEKKKGFFPPILNVS